ncbi:MULTISPECIES: tellurite resistance/C4-dicarboxylate transporter family protein [unclassified Bradyrhizobium]|uniref:tellurite resistance/C4-dicarboxylate transporter family protein n=1 Tax=unclassified Bradyrhizobium TaxID=2631580 RepID=UPI00247A0CD1|nr:MULTISPECIES: tellurite resistance/C4-dicarboxylate transporter family protein [unclassified Bradyrhizobium]WGS19754.1 tellurite resistance/C4-dicarboxylate transporter family protein [Bradyrhizobium sp. ISRA463]WGS26598.1 tellurite resistance/C4-dicarboxylate transporter family protein [Bradyrhizobium sp. ISRA464]
MTAVEHLSPAYFALVMATGVVSIGAWDFEFPILAAGLFAFNLAAYVVVACLTAVRMIRYPRLSLADMADHRLGPGFFAAVAGSCILGVQFLLTVGSLTAATAFLVIGTALWVGLTYTIFAAITVKREKPTLEKGLTGAWLIAVVAAQSIAVLAASIAGEWSQPLRLELNFFALSMWLWGGMLYIWIISLIFYRETFFVFSPGDLTPPYWINMGAMAISTLAGAGLVHNAPDAPFLASLLPFIEGFTIFYWATGTWWIPMLLVLEVWQHVIRRFPLRYDPLYWGAVFPLGMYAVATKHMAAALSLPFLAPLAPAFFVVALAAWTVVFIGLAWELTRRLVRPGE